MKNRFQSGEEERYHRQREHMGAEQLFNRGIRSEHVLAAMREVPRHRFVPPEDRPLAYADGPLPIGKGQTISQPYVVAAMTEAVDPAPGKRILEVGTGSGYQAAVLAATGAEVYSIERIPELAASARKVLESLGYAVHLSVGDGTLGWAGAAPFDGILVTAAPKELPPSFAEQLVEGGRLVIPVGALDQTLYRYVKLPDGELRAEALFSVRFVPLRKGE
ncbi:MAG: protein-L-isoaspartate(D-aspartate) O-methyltransferase [Verrucomicrobia bacterium]|jgi:protein-L-isoaspartate(D-aspartate) O-methyltransferase|nr:protein-L-isoaspartate(D-aspartate) O-methyltransferase [Verrucomicrobiota bacterium]